MDKDTKREELIESAYRCAKVLKEKYGVNAKVLKEKYGVKKVFLIGSLVYGTVHDRSDIDLVVEGLAPEQYVKALVDLSDMLQWDVEINLIPFEDAFESLKEKTLKKGKLIYG